MNPYVRKILKPLYYAILRVICFARINTTILPARLKKQTVIFIFGAPEHRNLGDQAILLAEIEFLKGILPEAKIVKVPCEDLLHNEIVFSWAARTEDIIMGHGGGNMGDVYMIEELCRRKFIQLFPNNRVINFPQTIHFTDTEKGKRELTASQAVYSQHKNLTLIAREEISYGRMQEAFPQNNVILTPDIVLSMKLAPAPQKREGLLLCLRDDIEATLNEKDRQVLSDFSKNHFAKSSYTDTVSKDEDYDRLSKPQVVHAKFAEFRAAEFVITDRLHGMVFAAITGTPCIAMANFNHKVSQTYRWIEHLPYIKFCKSTDELEKLFSEIDINQTYTYDPAYFAAYWKKIEDIITDRA